MRDEARESDRIRLPLRRIPPLRAALRRVGLALAVLGIAFVLVWLGRDGYKDSADGHVSTLDALYYTTVTMSTTGYGDIVPVSTAARLVNTVIITPLRVVFLVILVGTAFEVLTRRTRDEFRVQRWIGRLSMHTVVIGYGTKGRAAIETLRANGHPAESFIVVDRQAQPAEDANADGIACIVGDATRTSVLRQARIERAAYVVIAPDRDDTAVLVTLTVRQLNPAAVIAAAVRESENEPLLLQSGATAVITSAEATGRLLGFAALSPAVSHVFGDLLVHGSGLEIVERPVTPDEVGTLAAARRDQIVAVVREGALPLPFDAAGPLTPADRVVVVRSGPPEPTTPTSTGVVHPG